MYCVYIYIWRENKPDFVYQRAKKITFSKRSMKKKWIESRAGQLSTAAEVKIRGKRYAEMVSQIEST